MIYKANSNSIQKEDKQPIKDRYVFTAAVSSIFEDSHFECWTQKSIDNFANQLKNDKVALKDNHKKGTIGIGHSIDGWVEDGICYGKFSMPLDRPLGSDYSLPNVKHFREAIEQDDLNETSVGATAKVLCGIDGKHIKGFAAMVGLGCHERGEMYHKDPNNKDSDKVRCLYHLDNGSLNEVSLVPKGANREAKIIDKIKSGELTQEEIEVLKKLFGTSIDNQTNKSIFDINRSSNMNDNIEKQVESLTNTLAVVEKERDELKDTNAKLEEKIEEMTPAYERGKAVSAELEKEIYEKYKKLRAEGEDALEGDTLIAELNRYKKRLEKYDYEDLVYEKSHVISKLEFQESRKEKTEAEPGQKVNSDDSREDQKEKTQDTKIVH